MYFVKAQIVYEVKSTVESCVRAGFRSSLAYEQEIHKSSCVRAGDSQEFKRTSRRFTRVHAHELEIHRVHSCVRVEDSQNSEKSRVYELMDCKTLKIVRAS